MGSAVPKKLDKVGGYELGHLIICRRCINLNKGKVNCQVNVEPNVVKIDGDLFTLEKTGEEQHVGDRTIKEPFSLTVVLHVIQLKELQLTARCVFCLC